MNTADNFKAFCATLNDRTRRRTHLCLYLFMSCYTLIQITLSPMYSISFVSETKINWVGKQDTIYLLWFGSQDPQFVKRTLS